MNSRSIGIGVLTATIVITGVILLADQAVTRRATTPDLGGADRYLTHVSTDKPIYRCGEKVYIRGVLLHASDRTPLEADAQSPALVEIRGPKGDVVASGWVNAADSVLGFSWEIPADQAGGEYAVKVSHPMQGHAPGQRTFDIRAYRAPRLKTQIVFLRDGYGPGDEAVATLHAERAEGGIPAGATVTIVARVDGREIFNGPAAIDASGNCTGRFTLPEEIDRGEGTLAFVIEDGGVVETAAKTIPILLQTVDLQLFPEGGDLVAGLPNRVYFEAKTPARKPADIAASIVDADGNRVTTFRSEHEGRGRFTFTPVVGGQYHLRITEPSGIKATWPLPSIRERGAVIRAIDERVGKGQAIRLQVGSMTSEELTVTLSRREVEVASTKLAPKAGVMQEVTLTPPRHVDGVLIATVWGPGDTPLAERLVYRAPAETLNIDISTDLDVYVPGDTVTLTVETTDGEGRPIDAVVGLTVTDDSVLEMIETREQAPRLPVMVLLEDDVRELADAHVYLDDENPDAPLALDLLLGTQGWRRFAFVETNEFLGRHGDAARRVLALTRPSEREQAVAWRRAGEVVWLGAVAGADPKNGIDLNGDDGVEVLVDAALAIPAPAGDGVEDVASPALELNMNDARDHEVMDRFEAKEALLLEDAGERFAPARPRNDFVAVREYAHHVRPDRQPGDRVDFTETLFWNAGVRTDAETGKATFSFNLSDSVTTFRVSADAFSRTGSLGQATATVESVEPFYIEPKLPLEVTTGDVIQLPVAIISGLSDDLPEVTLTAEAAGDLDIDTIAPFVLASGRRERRLIEMTIGNIIGPSDLVIAAGAGPYADKVTRTLSVKPLGFPVEIAHGGMIDAGSAAIHEFVIPEACVPGSITTDIAVYPTPQANLTDALERLIQEPYGCFEQTSSTTYPLVMAQQYFQSHTGVDPSLIERSKEKLDKGYARLVSFECREKGYEWFAADPGHEALTAYGLMEFTDMGRVRAMDAAMLGRTRAWLLDRRDGNGGFTRERRALHTWIEDPDCSNGYITWALLEAGEQNLESEVATVRKAAAASSNSYVVALAANVLALTGDRDGARDFMDRLMARQVADGSVDGATTSIVGSGGEALKIETTSLAVLAWLHDPACAAAVEKGIRYLAESCKAGRFGSTQSTVLALRAIVAYDKSRARPRAAGTVRVYVDGQPVGSAVEFDETTQGAITLPDVSELLTPGAHAVEVRMTDGSTMPYAMAVNANVTQPPSSSRCTLDLNVALNDRQVEEGEITEAQVTVTNRTAEPVPTPIAIIGLPGGLEPRHDQLKELVKAGTIAAYEVLGREVVLYWRAMQPEQRVNVSLSLVAAIPGRYTGPASRAYLYYTDELKTWQKGTEIVITPRRER